MHMHQSLFQGDRNAFYDDDDEHHLSETAKFFIAGLMKHAREITAVTNQWVNSYKRLVPAFEAPTYVTWSTVNRADLIRVPGLQAGQGRIAAHRVSLARSGVQSVSGVQRDAGGGLEGHREIATNSRSPRR